MRILAITVLAVLLVGCEERETRVRTDQTVLHGRRSPGPHYPGGHFYDRSGNVVRNVQSFDEVRRRGLTPSNTLEQWD